MNDFITQGLAYIIDVANGNSPKEITAEDTEGGMAVLVQQALYLANPDSKKFEDMMAGLSLEKYCSIEVFKLAYALSENIHNSNIESAKEILQKLSTCEIPSMIFKKFISRYLVDVILRLRILNDYKDYVRTSLDLIKDTSVEDIYIFNIK